MTLRPSRIAPPLYSSGGRTAFTGCQPSRFIPLNPSTRTGAAFTGCCAAPLYPRPFCPCRDGQETTIEARMSHTFRPSPEERAHMTLRHCVSSRPLYPRGHGQRSQAVAPHHFTPPVLSKPARAHPHNVASSRFLPRSVQVDCCAITLHPAYSAHARKGSVHKLLN